MSCEAWGDPQPRVWWSKVEDRSLVSLVTRGDPGILSLRGLDRGDTGEFVCQVRHVMMGDQRVTSVCRPGTPLAPRRQTSISTSTVSEHHI